MIHFTSINELLPRIKQSQVHKRSDMQAAKVLNIECEDLKYLPAIGGHIKR